MAEQAVETVESRREATRKEYGQFVAVEDITHNGANAYTVGQPVPASNVKRYGYEASGQVKRVANPDGSPVKGAAPSTPDVEKKGGK